MEQVLSWDYTAVIYQSNWELAGSGKSSSPADLKEKAFVAREQRLKNKATWTV